MKFGHDTYRDAHAAHGLVQAGSITASVKLRGRRGGLAHTYFPARTHPPGGGTGQLCRLQTGPALTRRFFSLFEKRKESNMPRGGRRPGAGRPIGSINGTGSVRRRVPKDFRDEAVKARMLPLDFMLKVMRDENEDPTRRDRAAVAALRYVHPIKTKEVKNDS